MTRVVDGVAIEGRVINSEAYALFARGADFEVRGNLEQALLSYRAALAEDESAEIWTRIGALECRIGTGRKIALVRASGSPSISEGPEAFSKLPDAFEEALDIDPEYSPAWYERAVCERALGKSSLALESALKAVELDPERLETSLFVIRLFEQLGRNADAKIWLDALALRHHESVLVQRARLGFARRNADLGRVRRASEALSELTILEANLPGCLAADRSEIDRALRLGDVRRARSLAVGCQVSAGELALRAAAQGLVEIARAQADLVLGANPNDTNAWIAGLVASDLRHDEADFSRRVRSLGASPEKPSTLAVRLMAELWVRRSGEAVAAAWRNAYGPLPAPTDALERLVAARAGE